MNIEWIRAHCKSLPGTTEMVQWGDHLLFKIGGKMYAITTMADEPVTAMSFKSTPEEFAELIEIDGVIPAPYMARAHWVALEREDALPRAEIKKLLTRSYELVKEKLPKKVQAELTVRKAAKK